MAYTTATLNCIVQGIGSCPSLWIYTTTDTCSGTVDVDGYFSDGVNKGLKAGDVMIVVAATGGTVTTRSHYVESTTSIRASVTAD